MRTRADSRGVFDVRNENCYTFQPFPGVLIQHVDTRTGWFQDDHLGFVVGWEKIKSLLELSGHIHPYGVKELDRRCSIYTQYRTSGVGASFG